MKPAKYTRPRGVDSVGEDEKRGGRSGRSVRITLMWSRELYDLMLDAAVRQAKAEGATRPSISKATADFLVENRALIEKWPKRK